MSIKKEIVVSIPSTEEGIDVTVRKAGEYEEGVLFTHDNNKFVVSLKDLQEAIKALEEYNGS